MTKAVAAAGAIMGQDYTQSDWLQLLLLFVGMPFVAATGAALGLLGRVRLGGFLPSTIAGLAGAAIASASLYLGLWTLQLESTIHPSVLLEVYESGYQRHILIANLSATILIAFLFAIAWRSRTTRRAPTRLSISLRTVLLIQLLSLLCVGSWCGLRLLVFQFAKPSAMDARIWAQRDWTLTNNSTLAINCLSIQPSAVKAAMSREHLSDIAKFPNVNSLMISGFRLSEADVTPLASANNLRKITFCDCDLNTPNRCDLLRLQQLKSIDLQELTTLQPTLANLARLQNLTQLQAKTIRVQREDFRSLLADSRLESIDLDSVTILQEGNPIDAWPAATKTLSILRCNLTSEDLYAIGKLRRLTDLQLDDSPVDDTLLEHFRGLDSLQNASFKNGGITARGFEILIKQMRPQNLRILGGKLPLGAAASLSQMSNLESLTLEGVMLTAEDIGALSESTTLVELQITSPGLHERTLLMLARIPTLQRLHYPSFKGCRTFESFFSQERFRLQLPPTKLILNETIDAKGLAELVIP